MLSLGTGVNGGKGKKNKNRGVMNVSRPPKVHVSRFFPNEGDVIFKRLTFINFEIASDATGNIQYVIVSSNDARSRPAYEWANFSARYQTYRVRAVRIRGFALYPVNTTSVMHGTLIRGDYNGGTAPNTPAQTFADESARVCPTYKNFTDVITWDMNPNAKLWNPTGSDIPDMNQFAWTCISNNNVTLNASIIYYQGYLEWDVEFRGSQ